MRILAHRGYWNNATERNSAKAIRTALKKGYGFESDVRDYMGKLVLSHDLADSSSQDAEDIFRWLWEFGDKLCFAINIKTDGLKELLNSYLVKYRIENYFIFDMSVPQMVEYRDMGFRYFTRQSDFEKEPCLYEDAAGIWMDGFLSTNWITEHLVREHISAGKDVCLVSPELHGKGYMEFWDKVKEWRIEEDKLFICTDYPDEAREMFSYEKD